MTNVVRPDGLRVLLVGLGGFGRNHLRAWCEMGKAGSLYVAEVQEERLAECRLLGVPQDHLTSDYRSVLGDVDIVDVVTPTDSHFAVCRDAILAGRDVFVEKPMTLTSAEAEELAALVDRERRVLAVGYYYRFHPISRHLKGMIDGGELGEIRYITGDFLGFKRARTDVGVTHTDGIHFLDLCNWLLGSVPEECFAVTRDHFERGMEDLSLVVLIYPGGTVARVESGYVQPGHWRDKVVPNAFTTKALVVVGSEATVEVDYEIDSLVVHDVRHEFRDGTWWPVHGGSSSLNVGTGAPAEMLRLELADFLAHVGNRTMPDAGPVTSGVALAHLIEAIYRSSHEGRQLGLQQVGTAYGGDG